MFTAGIISSKEILRKVILVVFSSFGKYTEFQDVFF